MQNIRTGGPRAPGLTLSPLADVFKSPDMTIKRYLSRYTEGFRPQENCTSDWYRLPWRVWAGFEEKPGLSVLIVQFVE